MHNNRKRIGKEIAREIAISFFFVAIILLGYRFFIKEPLDKKISLLNVMTVSPKSDTVEDKKVEFDTISKRLKVYPRYGSIYATLKIPSISLELPVYFGDTKEILSKGVGHYSGSFFPGENGSIIMGAHNNAGYFRLLPNIQKNDTIFLNTVYGDFQYQVYDMKVVKTSEENQIPIVRGEEILMLYTCYPVTTVGYTNLRYVVYARKGSVST